MILFGKKLYTGKKAAGQRYELVNRLTRGEAPGNVYILTTPSAGGNLLDLYPARILTESYYQQKTLPAIGIAVGREEALELIRTILQECLEETGGTDILSYLRHRDYLAG